MKYIFNKETKAAFSAAFPHTIPVLTGYTFLGTAFGVLMQTKGYGVFWSVLMSTLCFCGSMQFVAITLLTQAFNPFQAFFLSVLVNARHLFYGISLLTKYKGLGKARGFLIFMLSDETFSIVSSVEPPENINKKYFYLFISILDHLYWIFGSFLGGMLGGFITFDTKGLDFVLTALFVVLFLEQIKNVKNRMSGVTGLICTAVGLIVFGSSNLIIPSMILIATALLVGRRLKCF